jgi:hypothetical protein
MAELQQLFDYPWQNMELDALLREFIGRRCPVIPVIHSA